MIHRSPAFGRSAIPAEIPERRLGSWGIFAATCPRAVKVVMGG